MAAAAEREYFEPADVPDELASATRSCVPACLAFLGRHAPPNGAPKWDDVLRGTSAMDLVIRNFNSLNDTILTDNLDNLFAAVMNKPGATATAGHAAVLHRTRDQMGTRKCYLFNPGKPKPFGEIDLRNSRHTQGWNNICAAFIPGTDVPSKKDDIISLVDSYSSDEDEAQSPIGRSDNGGNATASRSSSPSSGQNGSAHRARNYNVLSDGSEVVVASDDGSFGQGGSPPTGRRSSPRATKRVKRDDPSLFYKETLELIATRQDYSRVKDYTYSDQFLPQNFNEETVGQHVARYLLNRGERDRWVIWYHHPSLEFVIANTEKFSSYNIDDAEEGKDRFIGYTALADWARKEGIYEKSLKGTDGRAFLSALNEDEVGVGPEDNLPSEIPKSATTRKRKQKKDSNGAISKKKKKKTRDPDAEQEQIVAEFEEEEDRIENMRNDAKPAAAAKDSSPKSDELSSSSEEEDSSFGGGNHDHDDDDDDDDDEEYEFQCSDEEDEPKFKQASTKTTPQESSQEDNVDDVSDLEVEGEFSGAAQSSNQDDIDQREVFTACNQDQDMVNKIEELNAELKAKRQSEAKLKAKLKVKSQTTDRMGVSTRLPPK